jgi:hypothetical protein
MTCLPAHTLSTLSQAEYQVFAEDVITGLVGDPGEGKTGTSSLAMPGNLHPAAVYATPQNPREQG